GLFLCADSALQPVVDRENELRFFNYDLLLGRVDETHPLFSTFRKAGWSNADFGWFRDHALAIDGFGVNYYPQLSVYRIQGDPSHPEFVGVYGGLEYLEKLLAQYQQRYGGPLFLTETSINGPVEHQVRWWKESTQFCQSLAQKGMDLRGYTWFPAMDLINWDYRTGNLPLERYREPMGFIQLSMDAGRQWARRLSPLAEEMKRKLLPSGKGERRR
ncbi:MAG TPA: hypothetical protein P5560_01010, partial [Thermotogota bacterium]|nr:hypothetical protein [Thermotogota bacterium]